MEKIAQTIGKLIAVLLAKGILNENDRAFICGEITTDEWNEKEA